MPGQEDQTPGHDPFAAAREDMIERQLRQRGVVMHSVLEAMRTVPRHLFVPPEYINDAYADEALPSMAGQTISQPFMVAIMTQELSLRPGLRVLEIGTGTGYQTAILAMLVGPAGRVFTIEQVPALTEFARRRLAAMNIHNVEYLVGDGSAGWPADPEGRTPTFDRILVTAGSPTVPKPLTDQLGEGGVMVIPEGPADCQMLMRIERHGQKLRKTPLFGCRFVPLLGAYAWRTDDYARQKHGP